MSGQDLHRREYQEKQVSTILNELIPPDGFDSSLDLEEILTATCRAAVDLLKVDHSGLMVFDGEYQSGNVISEYPLIGTKGLSIPLRGVPAEERMICFRQPLAVPDISVDPSFNPVSEILRRVGIQSVLVVPLISKDTLIGSLGLDMIGELREFTEDEIKLCQIFAQQAAAVIDLYKQNLRRAEQLAAIKSTAQALSRYDNLTSILDTIIEQAVQLVDGTAGGIKQYNPERGEMTVIAAYNFPQLLGSTITLWEGLAGEVIRKDLPHKSVADYEKYPERAPVYAETQLFGAVLMINLKWQTHTMGVLFVNAKRGHEFPKELPPLLVLLASTAAIAIANSSLLHEAEAARASIRSSYEATRALVSIPNAELILQETAERALDAADASWVRVITFDEQGKTRSFLASRGKKLLETQDRIRPNGISRRVLRTGEPYLIEDVSKATEKLNDAMLEEGSRAALCLPLSFTGGQVGVIWIHYSAPRTFSSDDRSVLEAYLRQACIAYDNARQMEELEPLREATDRLAAAVDTTEVLNRIVAIARQILHADYAVFWPYVENEDESTWQLPLRDAVVAGLDPALFYEMRDTVLPIGNVTRRIMQQGWYHLDSNDDEWTHLPDETLELLRSLGIKSFEGLALVVGQEKLGVLYVGHNQLNLVRFDGIRRRRALAFATHAALVLKKAKLVDQMATGQMIAKKLAELTAFVDVETALNSIVANAKELFSCDAVTLFVYNSETHRIRPLTTMTGVSQMNLASHCEDAPRDSLVYQILEKDDLYIVPRMSDDELFRNSPFLKREQIESVCAIPLKVQDHRVGAIFLNYRSRHDFSDREITDIRSFGDQAAVIILNQLRSQEQTVKLLQQQFLTDLSEKLLGAKNLQESLDLAVDNAKDLLKADFVAVVRKDITGLIHMQASHGWTLSDIEAYESVKNDPVLHNEQNQTEYTMKQKEPVIVPDYTAPLPFKVPAIVTAKGIRSGMSVRIVDGGKPVGAMLVHYLDKRPLDKAQSRALRLIANLTAIAAQHHEAVESRIKLLSAVISASDEISKIQMGTDQRDVLHSIIEQAVRCLPQTFLGTIQTYDKNKKSLRLESVFSAEGDNDNRQVGTERRLDRRDEGTIGVTGRAVLTREPQLVPDVSVIPHYFNYHEETRSELAVPILDKSGQGEPREALGVINVESKQLAAFTKDDQQALEALARLAGTTIQKAEQYRLLEGSMLLAWFGMASSGWGHNIAQKSDRIRNNIKLLRWDLEDHTLEAKLQKILDDRLNVIDEIAIQIRREPLLKLIQNTEDLWDIYINRFIENRLHQLRTSPPYDRANYELDLAKENPVVRCNADWLGRMLDILIDNALESMANQSLPTLTLSTAIVDGTDVEISVADSGPGIPEDIRELIFKQRIEKPSGSKGLGLGLLMVRVIAHIYKGKAGVGATGPTGTTMYVRLPIVSSPELGGG